MSRCDKYLEMLSQYLDGELPESEQAALREHLDNCPECQSYYDAFLKISHAMDEVEAPAGFSERVMSAVRSVQEAAPAPTEEKPRRRRKLSRGAVGRVAALAACLALVVAAGVKLYVTERGDATAAGEPVQFSVAMAEGEGAIRQTEENAGSYEADEPACGSSNYADGIAAITVSNGETVTRVVDEGEIATLAAILEYGEAGSVLPEAQADYSFEFDGERGTVELLVWEVDNELVCLLNDELVWVAAGTATELAKELNLISLESSGEDAGGESTPSNSGTG